MVAAVHLFFQDATILRGASSLCAAIHVFLYIIPSIFALWTDVLAVQSRGSPHGVSMALYTVHQHKEHPRALLHLLGDGRCRRRLDGGQGDHRRLRWMRD